MPVVFPHSLGIESQMLIVVYSSTCAISVIRIKYLKQGGDFSYENIEASSWSIAELVSRIFSYSSETSYIYDIYVSRTF
jgi:hypothetical protein